MSDSIRKTNIEEIPGFSVVEFQIGGGMIIRDNSDWYTYINEEGRAFKIQRLPNLRVKWGYAEDW